MARKLRPEDLLTHLDDMFCPICNLIWGSKGRKHRYPEGKTKQGRTVAICTRCYPSKRSYRRKDLPGQQTFC